MRKFEEIRIENTNICPLNCITCPREKMSRVKGRMSYAAFVDICNFISGYIASPNVRYFDVHGYGEPVIDNEIIKKIRYVKNTFPKVRTRMVSSLYVATFKFLEDLIDSGLDELIISCYGASESDYQLIHGRTNYMNVRHNIEHIVKKNKEFGSTLMIIFENLDFSHVLSSDQESSRKKILNNWQKSLDCYGVVVRNIVPPHNWGSAYQYRNVSPSVCYIVSVFRSRVLQVTWNGDVIPCCFDYNADVVFGNLFENDLESIFNSSKYREFILCHKKNKLECFPPCRLCNRCLIP